MRISLDVDQLLRCDPGHHLRIYSSSYLRSLLVALRATLDATRDPRWTQPGRVEWLRSRAARCHAAHTNAVAGLLSSNRALEEQVRTIGWALAAPEPWACRCYALSALELADLLRPRPAGPQGTTVCHRAPLVWWLDPSPSSSPLNAWIASAGGVLLADARNWPGGMLAPPVILDANPACVLRADGRGRREEIHLSGAAARVQAWLTGPGGASWHGVTPPLGFLRLEHAVSPDDLLSMARHRRTAALDADGTGREIVVSSDLLPKRSFTVRCSLRDGAT